MERRRDNVVIIPLDYALVIPSFTLEAVKVAPGIQVQ